MSAVELIFPSGLQIGGKGVGRTYGSIVPFQFPGVASVGAGVAITAVQSSLYIPVSHRIRAAAAGVTAMTAVAAGTDPTFDIYRHLPAGADVTGFSGALESPAVAGLVESGVHKYAIIFYNAAGVGLPSRVISVTVADAAVNGKVRLVLPLGPSGITGRKIYRTAAAGTQLKLLATVADNTTITYLDNTADASLGANIATADASGTTILSAPIALSDAYANYTEQLVAGALTDVAAPVVRAPCQYSLRVTTGASTGALTNLYGLLQVEILA